MSNTKITETVYTSLQSAYDFFNKELFSNELSDVLITLNRKTGAYGYFSAERFIEKTGLSSAHKLVGTLGDTKSEIALNPDTFDRTDSEILATLAHEMCHHWQHTEGHPGKTRGYHNGEWATKMKSIGLSPLSATTGSKGTGVNVTHEIVISGKYYAAVTEFLVKYTDFDLSYSSKPIELEKPTTYTKHSFRYECPKCKVWAKAPKNTKLVCENCLESMICVDTKKFTGYKHFSVSIPAISPPLKNKDDIGDLNTILNEINPLP